MADDAPKQDPGPALPDLRGLRALVELSECGSILRAAAALDVSRSTVRRLLSELEETVGSRLVNRTRDGVQLTAEGEQLAERALDAGCREHGRLGFHLLSYLRWEGGRNAAAAQHMLQAELLTRGEDGPGRASALAEACRRLDVPLVLVESASGLYRSGAGAWGVDSLPADVVPDMVLWSAGGQLGHVFVGERYSIADMACWPWVITYKAQGIDLGGSFPNVRRWYDALKERPALRRGYALGRDERGGAASGPDEEARKVLFGGKRD